MTLNQNEFLSNLVNLVVETRVNATTNGKRINDLIDFCLTDTIEYGEGKLLISVDTLKVSEYSQTSSLLTNELPIVDEQVIETTDRKFIHLTLNRYLMKGAFANEYSLSEALAVIESMLEKTKNIYMYRKIVEAFENWTSPVETQTVTIDIVNTSTLSGSAKLEQDKANAIKIYENVRKYALNMQTPSRKYNELGYEEMYNANDLGFIVNEKYDTYMNTYAYASLLNSDKLNNIQLYDKSIILPTDQINEGNINTIGWLCSKYKYQIAPRFMVSGSFEDISNLNIQDFLHFWLNSGFAKGLAMVKFVARLVDPVVVGA